VFSRRSRLITFVCLINDLIATVVAFAGAYSLRVSLAGQGPFSGVGIYPFRYYLPVLLAALLIYPVCAYSIGAYRQLELRRPRDLASDTVKISVLGMLALTAILFGFKGQYVSRSLLLIFAVLEFALLALVRWFLLVSSVSFRTQPEHRRNFVIVGSGTGALQLASLLEEGERFGFHLLAMVSSSSDTLSAVPEVNTSYPVLPLSSVPELLHNHVVDEVLFAVDKDELASLEPLMRQCEQEGVHMRVNLDFLPTGFSHVFVEHLAHVPLLTFSSAPQNELALYFKRASDILISSVALLLLSPLLAVLAAAIKLTSSGPVFFRQQRCGLGGRRFSLLKFRSMVNNADQLLPHLEASNEVDGPVFKIRNDPRCTPLGRWLRMLSLDELPQLWNVLRGDMSLVGPRPPLPEEVKQYEPWQRRRLRMRPGLTCLWALEGRSHLRFDRWVKLDLLYIDNWSMWLDLKILLRTIPAVVSGRGAH
jgi:exopolysaccharide biosynthesis polyprenyl glycosylphosphotransferase